ncbi:hypothetical protein CRENBAI_003304 [Crenichthys baileyi]|uniref:Uncharacterized protein n=1 Tax=Crenichthys baileyi TaxID=28760 RepID=A0AAV9RNR3_9TELE
MFYLDSEVTGSPLLPLFMAVLEDPLSHDHIERECQKTLEEIAASMGRLPAPSSARLSTEGRRDASAPASAGDQPDASVLEPAPGFTEGSASASAPASTEGRFDVPGPIPEGSEDEPPSHPEEHKDKLPLLPVSVPGPVLEGSKDEPPSHPVPAREGFGDGLPSLLVPVPAELVDEPPPIVPFLEGFEDELPPIVRVPEGFEDEPPPLPVPTPEKFGDELPSLLVPVPEEFKDEGPRTNRLSFLFQRGWGTNRLQFGYPDFREGAGMHSLNLLSVSDSAAPLQGSAADLHSFAEGSSGFCTALLSSTASLSVGGILTACSEGPLICSAGLLYTGSRQDILLVAHLNYVSARDDLRAVHLNCLCSGRLASHLPELCLCLG